jgi:CheY-like chemotaxis protein
VVSIPLRPFGARATGSTPARGSTVAPTLSGLRVLVVDDSEDVRLLIAAMLQRHGASCTLAASCEEALAELGRGVPDVLISDIGLPRDDGYTLIRRVREGIGLGLPAAALTAYASADDGKKVLEAGFQMHLTKPITQPALVAAVAKLAGRARE